MIKTLYKSTVFTVLSYLVLGLMLLDDDIHTFARVAAGILLTTTHVFMLITKHEENQRKEAEAFKLAESTWYDAKEYVQEHCKHVYEYASIGDRCVVCAKHNGK